MPSSTFPQKFSPPSPKRGGSKLEQQRRLEEEEKERREALSLIFLAMRLYPRGAKPEMPKGLSS